MKYGNYNVTISPERVLIRERIGRRIFLSIFLALAIGLKISEIITHPAIPGPGDTLAPVLDYVMPLAYLGMAWAFGLFSRPVSVEIDIAANTLKYNGKEELPPSQLLISETNEAISSHLMLQLPDGHLHTFEFLGRSKARKLLEAMSEVLPPEKMRWKNFGNEFNLRQKGQLR